MAEYTKEAFETKYNDPSVGLYRDGKPIVASNDREFVTDLKDSVVWNEDPSVDNSGVWKQDRVRLKTSTVLPDFTFSTVDGVPTLTADDDGALLIDGVVVDIGDSVMVSEESTLSYNGVYIATSPGTFFAPFILTLRVDSRTPEQIAYSIYKIMEGDDNGDTLWKQTYSETGSIGNVAYEEFRLGGTESEVTSTISSAAVLTANSVPLELISSPGAGMANIPIYFIVSMDFGTTPYDTHVEIAMQYADGTQIVIDSDFLASSADKVRLIAVSSVDGIVSSAIQFKVNTGNPANGDSPIKILTKYKTITI